MIDHRTYGFREDDYIYAAHPDPSFARRNWLSLDGEWILEHRGSERKIRVPYPIGSEHSGVDFRDSGTFIYRRDFEIPGWSAEKRYLLKVGAADYESSVRVNGIELGSHVGGYASFALDMSRALREGTNRIEIEVRDSHSPFQVRGKQTFLRGPFAVWYAGISGIWQPVWVEETGPGRIARAETRVDFVSRRIRVVAYLDIADESPNAARGWELSVSVRSPRGIPGGGSGGEAPDGFQAAHYGERTFLAEYSERDGRFECSFGFDEIGAALWSHSEPNLHAMSLRLSRDGKPSDQVESYFGIRDIGVGADGIRINGERTFLRMALVQGYYPGGVYAPESYSQMEADLLELKALRYNGARVHEKAESPYFSYLCDRLGVMTSFEMPSFYLPSARGFERYASELEELILRDMAHPSCIMRMLFNETWGIWGMYASRSRTRRFVLAMRDLAKRLDPTRPVIDNSGWEHIRTDIADVHHYLRSASLARDFYRRLREGTEDAAGGSYGARAIAFYLFNQISTVTRPLFLEKPGWDSQAPLFLSEYGGFGWYDTEAKVSAAEGIGEYTRDIVESGLFCGYCYTQLYDVGAEVNGLLSFDRRLKVDPDLVRKANGLGSDSIST